jgi:hypothetical protein
MANARKSLDGPCLEHDGRSKHIADSGRGLQDLELRAQFHFLMEDGFEGDNLHTQCAQYRQVCRQRALGCSTWRTLITLPTTSMSAAVVTSPIGCVGHIRRFAPLGRSYTSRGGPSLAMTSDSGSPT